MKALPSYLIIAAAVTLAPWLARAQDHRTLYVTAGGGVMHITGDYSESGLYAREDVGYVGRVGIQSSVLSTRFRLGAEVEYNSYLANYTGPELWCNWGLGSAQNSGCDPERTTIRSLNLRGQWALTSGKERFQPYVSFGTGWMRVPTNRDPETLGPKTDIGLGLAFDPLGTGWLQVAIEPRYTFFYFPDESFDDKPNQLSVAAVTSVRLVRW